jgi:transcription elongation factor Elf1
VTRRKPLSESKRPRRQASESIRAFFGCPFCSTGGGLSDAEPLRVVAYRRKTVRVECSECGGRFSFNPLQLADAVARLRPEAGSDMAFLSFIARGIASAVFVGALRDRGLTPDEIRAGMEKLGITDSDE